VIIYVGESAILSYTPPAQGGHFAMQVGADAVDKQTTVLYNTVITPTLLPANLHFGKRAFRLTAHQSYLLVPNMSFQSPLTITIDYLDWDVAGLNERFLALYSFDTSTNQWTNAGIEVIARDPLNNRIVVQINYFTEFALLQPDVVSCPQADIDSLLHSGATQVDLDGNCTYLLSESASGYAFFDLWNRQNLVIDGHGATIKRLDSAPEKGVLAFFQSQNVTLKNLTIRGGKATSGYGLGGAIWIYRSTASLENVQLIGNSAQSGGALQVEHVDSQVSILNSVFANNSALEKGAAIYATGQMTIQNSTLVDVAGNSRQGILTWSSAAITNSIISGFEVGLMSAGQTTVLETDYNLFANNGADTQELGGGRFVNGAHNNSYTDMRFVDPANDDFRLRFTSPAIDKGTDLGIWEDADGQARPFAGGLVDVGAYEFQGEGGPALSIYRYNPLQAVADLPFVYRFLVQNQGVAPATDLIVSDILPEGVSVVAGSISDGGAVVGNQVQWTLADLAPGGGKVFSYQAQTAQSVQNTDYRVYSTTDPEVYAIGAVKDTFINADIVAALDFAPVPDGYQFANFVDTAETDISEADLIAVFGADAVCKTQNPCVLSPVMRMVREIWLANLQSGHSAGMAISSQRLFADPTFAPATLQADAHFINDLRKEEMRRWISLYNVIHDRTPANASELTAQGIVRIPASDPNSVLDLLIANLRQPNATDRYWLLFAKSPTVRGGGWHGVLPYAVQQVNDDEYLIHFYDPNTPNRTDRAVQINRSSNSWSYIAPSAPDRPLYDYFGDATADNFRLMSSQWAESLPKRCDTACTAQSAVQGTAANGDEVIEFQLDGEGYFLVTRSDGKRVGYHLTNGSSILEIPGAEQLPIVGGFGLNIPSGIRIVHQPGMTYAVTIASRDTAYGNPEATVRFNVSGPNYVVSVTNLKLTMPQIAVNLAGRVVPLEGREIDSPFDSLELGLDLDSNGVTVESGGYDSERPGMAMSINNPNGADYSFAFSGMAVQPGYAASISFDQSLGKLSIENNDPETNNYTVNVERLGQDGVANTAEVATNDGTSFGSVITLNESWQPGEAPVIEPNITPILPQQLWQIFFPMIVALPPLLIFLPLVWQ